MDFVYLPIIARFKANEQLFTDNNLKPIAHYDRYKGQYLNPELHQPWPHPALFIKFNIIWEDQGNLTQVGLATVEFHLELENYSESYDGSPDQANALEDYLYQTMVYVLMQNFSTADFSGFKRRSTEEDENPSNTNVTIMRFDFQIIDKSAQRFKDYIFVTPDDMRTIKKPLPTATVPDYGDEAFII